LGHDQPLGDALFKTDPSHRELQVYWTKLATELLAEGKLKASGTSMFHLAFLTVDLLKTLPFTVLGGLEKVSEGLDILRSRKNDGKLVYDVAI